MNAPIRKMTIGDRAPNFILEDLAGEQRELYNTDLTGGPILLLIGGSQSWKRLQRFATQEAVPEPFGAHRYALVDPDGVEPGLSGNGFTLLRDPGEAVRNAYLDAAGLSAPALFALDPNQRIVAMAGAEDVADFGEIASTAFDRIAPKFPPRLITKQAPVLFIPEVLDNADCDRLINAWRSGEKRKDVVNVASGQKTSQAGRSEVKRRSDVVIEGALERHLLVTLMPRIAPEIERVYAFDKEWGFEKFRIGCYEAEDAGFFRPHRDNPSEALSHRQFAASFNLNDGYEGGYLRFPEYGVDHYAPPKGGVLIFSCGLLHEVVPITSGRRFTLLTFVSTRL
jgi:predicted 2-oxoglutarate/Fe(II)-dependent dioxygenase YbiX